MTVVTVTEAKQHFEQLIDHVIADAEPAIVVTDAGQRVVVIALDDFNAWRETLYITRESGECGPSAAINAGVASRSDFGARITRWRYWSRQ